MDFKYFKDLIKKDKNKAITELKNIKDIDLAISLIKAFGTFIFDGLNKDLKEEEKILDFLLKNNFNFFLNIYKKMNDELQDKYVFKNIEKLYQYTKVKSKKLKETVIFEKKLIYLLNENELEENFRNISYVIIRDLELLQYSKIHQEDDIFIYYLLIYYPASEILKYCNKNIFLHKTYRCVNFDDALCRKILIEKDIDTIFNCVAKNYHLLEQTIILENILKNRDYVFQLVEKVPTLDFLCRFFGQIQEVEKWKDISLLKLDEIPSVQELYNHRLVTLKKNMDEKSAYEIKTEYLISYLSINFRHKIAINTLIFMSILLKLPIYHKTSFELKDFYDVFISELESNNPFPMTKTLKTTYSSFVTWYQKSKIKIKDYKEDFFEFIVGEKKIGSGLYYDKLAQILQLICEKTNLIAYDRFLGEYSFNKQLIYKECETDLYMEILKAIDLLSQNINIDNFDINEVKASLDAIKEDENNIKQIIYEISICKKYSPKHFENLLEDYCYSFLPKFYKNFYVTTENLSPIFSKK